MNKGRLLSSGQIIIQVLVFASVSVVLLSGLVSWAAVTSLSARHASYREQAFQIAEAGVEYYRWHLAHAPEDFQDGTGAPGPYVHAFADKDGNTIGSFSLDITPPPVGSTMVTIRSTGVVDLAPQLERTVEARLAIPSFAKYAWAMNSHVSFGSAAEVFGLIHSNDGLRFDGIAHNLVTSAKYSYDDPDHSGAQEYGVHTHDSPTDPTAPQPPQAKGTPPSRPDIFLVGRQIEVPAIDFPGLTASLSHLLDLATTSGRHFAASGASGYHVVLKNNDTFDVYRVNSLRAAPASCYYSSPADWGTWSINSQTLLGNYAVPANGVVFLEDNTWVDGTINSARITIAVGTFPDSGVGGSSITVNNDVRYTNYDGQDVIGLIAQNNFNVGLYSENDLRIDAAIVAKNGRIGRFKYDDSNCDDNGLGRVRTQLTTFGMLATNQRSAFWYSSSGYQNRDYNYDANLLYAPPPSFPLTSDQYSIISWQEVQ